jgi:hypothetical protein
MAKRGGKRNGAGRKPAPYKTKTLSFRIREAWEKEIKETVKNKILELTKNYDALSNGFDFD